MTRRIARTSDGTVLLGDESGFVPLSAVRPDLDSIGDALRVAPEGLPDPGAATASRVPESEITFGPPLDPGKLLGIGLNYVDHADDLAADYPEEPASFFKPASAAVGPGGPIRLPDPEVTDRVTAEGELAVVLGRTCTDLSRDDVGDVVAGVLPVIDMTAEDILQRNPRFLTRSKSFDTFLVLGPWIQLVDLTGLSDTVVETVRNGETVASDVVRNMAFSPAELVAFHSRVMTLEPGDLISTGTPGAGEIDADDHVEAVVEGVGSVGADVV